MDEKSKRIEEYVSLFREIERKVGDDQVAMVILAQMGKDERQSKIMASERSGRKNGGDQPASDKQLDYLASLGGEIREGMSKAEASAAIDELLGAK